MATSTSTWLTGITADWSVAADWTPTGVPNDANTAVLINAIPASGTAYAITIVAGSTFAAAGATLNNAGATLSVGGRLNLNNGNLAISKGTVALNNGVIDGIGTLTGFLRGRGTISGTGTLTNQGTISNDVSGTLTISAPFLNSGTVLAANPSGGSVVRINGASSGNYAAGTLTGGTFVAQTTGFTENSIRFQIGAASTISTNAATLIMSGPSADIKAFNGTIAQSIALQLQTIASTGVLQLLNAKSFIATNTLTNAGTLTVQGGTLQAPALTVTGTLTGFGILNGNVANTGTIAVSGGALDVNETITGAGALKVGSGGRLILEGASPGSLHNDGIVYNTTGVLNLGSITGSGTLVVENGATITLGQATTQTVMFGGANATLRLDDPLSFGGTLVGFGRGDTFFAPDSLILGGVKASGVAIVNKSTLAIISGASTIDTMALSGDFSSATFTTTVVGNDTIIKAIGGTPVRNGLAATITVTGLAAVDNTTEAQIVSNLEKAISDWGQYVTGHAPLRIALTLSNLTEGSRLAEASITATIRTGEIISGQTIAMPSSIYALTTGNYISGTAADVNMTVFLGGSNLSNLFIDPDPYDAGSIPSLKFDLTTVFRHEMGHGLGIYGLTTPTTGVKTSQSTLYDVYTTTVLNSGTVTSATFTGPNAMAAYGTFLGTNTPTAIPLTAQSGDQNLYHIANSTTEPLGTDLMNGIGIPTGTSMPISMVDLAILRDVGLPVTAGIVCYGRGTRIATPTGEKPIEALCVGDAVLVREGDGTRTERIRWIGHRHIDLTRHDQPWLAEPIRIRRHALAPDVPRRDLLVSPPHGILIDDALVPATLLVNHMTILREAGLRAIDYFHIELDHHAILLAEGLAAESYLDTANRSFFDNGGPVIQAHPDFPLTTALDHWADAACAPLLVAPETVRPIWKALADRALAMGHVPPESDTYADPDLHVRIGERRIDPIAVEGSRLTFVLPAGPGDVRLVSRHTNPALRVPFQGDHRALGVAIRRLVFRGPTDRQDMPADHPALHLGWHAPETDGATRWRWTDGTAELPVPPSATPWLLEVHLGPTTDYVVVRPNAGQQHAA